MIGLGLSHVIIHAVMSLVLTMLVLRQTFIHLEQVYGLPALILFKGGSAVVKREGAISKKLLLDWLSANGVSPA